MGLSVYKINFDTDEKNCLYEYIDNINEAELLAQLAMTQKRNNELIFIMPGGNKGIHRNPEEYKRALQLAKKYECLRYNETKCEICGKHFNWKNITQYECDNEAQEEYNVIYVCDNCDHPEWDEEKQEYFLIVDGIRWHC